MSKVKKLCFSLVLLVVTLAVTAYGVYSAVSSSIAINSTISFTATDLAVKIDGAITGGITTNDAVKKSTYSWTNYTSDSVIDPALVPPIWNFETKFNPEDTNEFPQITFTFTINNYMGFDVKSTTVVTSSNNADFNSNITTVISGTNGITNLPSKGQAVITITFTAKNGHDVSFSGIPTTIKVDLIRVN